MILIKQLDDHSQNNGFIDLNIMMSYFISKSQPVDNIINYNKMNSVRSLINYNLVHDILYYDLRLEKIINEYYKHLSVTKAVVNMYTYIVTIDILAYEMKKIYHLDKTTIALCISEYLIKYEITKFKEKLYLPKQFELNGILIAKEIFDDIIYKKIIDIFRICNKFHHIQKFLTQSKSKTLKLWIVDEFIKRNGIIGIKKILTTTDEAKIKVLLKDIAKFIEQNFVKLTLKEKMTNIFR